MPTARCLSIAATFAVLPLAEITAQTFPTQDPVIRRTWGS